LLAVFGGNGGLVTASARLNQVVDQALPSVTITSSVNPSFAGHPVAFSITVSAGGAGPVPTGNIDVTSGGSTIFRGTLDGAGGVSFTTTGLPAGADVLTAHYAGDSNYPSVISSPFNQKVSQNTDTTTLTIAPNPGVFGQSVNFTATVTGTLAGSPQPTGAVRFSDAGNFLVAGDVDNLGRVTVAVNSLAAGTHNIVASYIGDANFAPSISTASVLALNKAPTTIALETIPSASVVGQNVTLTATVTAAAATATPTGAVSFSDGVNLIGTATLDQGKATVRVPFLTPGTHLITARYAGDVDFAPSMSNAGALSEVVGPSNTVVVPSSTANPSVYGQTLSLTVIVSASGGGGGIPNGTVLLADGNSSLGTLVLDATGKGALTIASLGMGSHSITATYNGSASYLPSTSSALTQVVNRDPVLVTLTSVPNPSTAGQNVSFNVQVTPAQPGGSAGTAAPTGTIVLNDATTILGSATLNSTGKAQISTPNISAGSHVLTASYQGDANFLNGSSGQYTHVVTKLSATATLSSSQNPTTNASALTLTAKINSNALGTPSGTVTLSDGAQQLSSSQISNTGIAIFQVSNLPVGDHTFSVSYSGDSTFLSTQSPSVNETVVDSHSTVTLASSANPQDLGKPISFVATVTPALGGIASTGNVAFLDGSASLASVPVKNSKASFTTASVPVGLRQISARYQASSSPGPFDGTSSILEENVQGIPDFSISVQQPGGDIFAGQKFSTTVTLTPLNGLKSAVNTVCTGAPLGSTCTVNPSSARFDGTTPVSGTVVITTTGPVHPPSGGPAYTLALAGLLFGLAFIVVPVPPKRGTGVLCALLAAAMLTGCGASHSSIPKKPIVTPPGTYTLTLRSQSGSLAHSALIKLTVH
jgi:Bacterial Ig-like domain (group 3)